MLSGFFDGSGPGHSNGRYVIAGFVARAQTWCDIAEEWERVLALKPAIPLFKLGLSRNPEWRGQFKISDDQMKSRTKKLAALVTPPKTLFSVVCSIDESEFREVVEASQIRGDKDVRKALGKLAFTTAYQMLFHSVVARTLWKVHDLGICGDQVDFVFDRENELFDNANKLLKLYREDGLPPEINDILGDAVQRDEEKVLPLQAADLIAGRAKDYCNDFQNRKFHKVIARLAGSGNHNTTLHYRKKHIVALIRDLCGASSKSNTLWTKDVASWEA